MPAPGRSAPSNPFLPLLKAVQVRVDARLARVTQLSLEQGLLQGAEVGAMIATVADLCARGGKRLRPALCQVGAVCASEDAPIDVVTEVGVSLELLQAYFLIHDDWMDQDDERRGGPTAHVSLTQHFGDPDLGARAAILAGDHAISLAQKVLAESGIPKARLGRALAAFAAMQLQAVAGQQLDIVARAQDPELTYLLKTASYTVLGPLSLGAELARGSRRLVESLRAFAEPAGIAFQLRDDLIGVFGDPEKTGKPRGGDLTAGKNTPLVREAFARLSGVEKQKLRGVWGSRGAAREEVDEVVDLLERSGAREVVEQRIGTLSAQAREAITLMPATKRGKRLLRGGLSALTERDA